MYITQGGSTAQWNKSQILILGKDTFKHRRPRVSKEAFPFFEWLQRQAPFPQIYSQDHQATECTTCWRGWPSSITPLVPVDGSDSTSFFKILQMHPTHPTLPCLSANHCPFSSRVPAAEWRESWGADVPMTPQTGLKGWEQGQLSSVQRTPREQWLFSRAYLLDSSDVLAWTFFLQL